MSNNEKLEQLIDDYEFEDGNLDNLANDIREAVMRLAWNGGSDMYRFNQIGIIYTALQQMVEGRAEMNFKFHQVVEMIDDGTNTAKEES